MASSMLTTDRRWASRKSGMTVLGKVPKPINLPSQRLENNGLDPNVEIVPKGTITWGSRPSSASSAPPNAWNNNNNSSAININNNSPKKLNPDSSSVSSSPDTRPGSSGSVTRPATANTERPDSSSSYVWGPPGSRPSSASGLFTSGHPPASAARPRSAEMRPASSHLSRFADVSGDSKGGVEFGATKVTNDKWGRPLTESGRSFTLTSGDFPTLGSDKNAEPCRGNSSHGRPSSGLGRDAKPKDLEPPPTTGDPNKPNVNILKTEDPPTPYHSHRDPAPPAFHPPLPHQHPPAHHVPHLHTPAQQMPTQQMPAQHFESWRSPPPPNHMPPPVHQPPPDGIWYGPGGPGPYSQVGPPVSYPLDPSFVYYPSPHNPTYLIPAHPMNIPARPGFHAPTPYESGFYGPHRPNFYHNNNNNNTSSNNNNNIGNNQTEKPNRSESGPRQYRVLLKNHNTEERNSERLGPAVILTRGDHSSGTGPAKEPEPPVVAVEKMEPPVAVARKNSSLIQKIEGLNNKARSLDSQNAMRVSESEVASKSDSVQVERRGNNNEQKKTKQQRSKETVPVPVPVPVSVSVEREKSEAVDTGADTSLLDPADYEIQRAKLKEKAAQRAKELQREEEERMREQLAKAHAKLEQLDRRAATQATATPVAATETVTVTDEVGPAKETNAVRTDVVKTAAVETTVPAVAPSFMPKFGSFTEDDPVISFSSGPQSSESVPSVKSTAASHLRHKQTGYRKRHSSSSNNNNNNNNVNNNNNDISNNNSVALDNNPDEKLSGSVQVALERTDLREELPVPHKKRGHRNLKNRSKPDISDVKIEKNSDEIKEIKETPLPVPTNESANAATTTAPTTTNNNSNNSNSNSNNKTSVHWKPHQMRRPARNQQGTETVVWAPVKNKANQSEESNQTVSTAVTNTTINTSNNNCNSNNIDNINSTNTNNNMEQSGSSKSESELQVTGVRTKRAEMERYVPKPKQIENPQNTPVTTVAKAEEPALDVRTAEDPSTNTRTARRGRAHTSWRQRTAVEPSEGKIDERITGTVAEPVARPNSSEREDGERNTLGTDNPVSTDLPIRQRRQSHRHKGMGGNFGNYENIGNSNGNKNETEIGTETTPKLEIAKEHRQWKPKSNYSRVNESREEGKMDISHQEELGVNKTHEPGLRHQSQRGNSGRFRQNYSPGEERESSNESNVEFTVAREGEVREGNSNRRYRGRGRNSNLARRTGATSTVENEKL